MEIQLEKDEIFLPPNKKNCPKGYRRKKLGKNITHKQKICVKNNAKKTLATKKRKNKTKSSYTIPKSSPLFPPSSSSSASQNVSAERNASKSTDTRVLDNKLALNFQNSKIDVEDFQNLQDIKMISTKDNAQDKPINDMQMVINVPPLLPEPSEETGNADDEVVSTIMEHDNASIEADELAIQEQPGNVENTISVTASIVKDGRTKNQKLVDEIFKPNSDGKSDWITRETLIKSDLNFSGNGNQRHGAFFKDDRFIWDSKRGKRNTVLALRTNGFQDYKLIQKNWPIRPDIKAHYKKMACVFCGQHSELVCDHKNDIYNDPRVQNRKTQTMDDFQSCCNGCNLRKRQVAIVRNRTGKRIGATTIPNMAVFGIDFIEGDDTYDETDVNAMVGTYWYDPIAFNKKIKELLAIQSHT